MESYTLASIVIPPTKLITIWVYGNRKSPSGRAISGLGKVLEKERKWTGKARNGCGKISPQKLRVFIKIHGLLTKHGGQFVEHLKAVKTLVSQFLAYFKILRPEMV